MVLTFHLFSTIQCTPKIDLKINILHGVRVSSRQILPIFCAKKWRKIGELWLNLSSQKIPGLMSYEYPCTQNQSRKILKI